MKLSEAGAKLDAEEIQAKTVKTMMLIKSCADRKQQKQMLEATA